MIKIVEYIVYNSYYIALCAAGMVMMNMHHLRLSVSNHITLPLFIFCTTLLAYRFHYIYKAKASIPDVRTIHLNHDSSQNTIINIVLTIVAAISFSYFNIAQIILIFSIILLTLLYSYPLLPRAIFHKSKIKSYGYVKPFYLALVWTLCVAVLPMLTSGILFFIMPIIYTYFFMLSLCILFDLKDVASDRKHGIITIPQLINSKWLFGIITSIIFVNNSFSIIQLNIFDLALFITSLVQIWITYRIIFKTPENAFLYLLLVDGLMLMWSIIYFILQFSTIWQ